MQTDERESSEQSERANGAGDGRRHILLVEDSALVSDALRILFEETGRRVTVAHTVRDAIAAAQRDPPDLTLLDLTLRDGDGLPVAEYLRAARAGTVVALTGRDERAVAERCLDAGCSAVLVKPVPTQELLARVAGWLGEPATSAG